MGALLDLALGADAGLPVRVRAPNGMPNGQDAGRENAVAPTEDLDRGQRIAQAIRMLQEAPSHRTSFIAGPENPSGVPVTVVIRADRMMITGEVLVPKDRWDPVLFMRFLRDQDERSLT
jgi:hypothetical protein